MSFLKQKPILILSLSLNFVFVFFVIYFVINNRESLTQKWIEKKGKATIVMFGDSHTARPDWNVLLSRKDVKRSGYGGFTSEQLAFRVYNDVIQYHPQICFIQCGGNDLNSIFYSADNVILNISNIIDSLKAHTIVPVVQSLFHRHNNTAYNTNVEKMNDLLQNLAIEQGVIYLDIDQFLIDENGLRKELTVDNIHFNDQGYLIWVEQVEIFLLENGI